jgi:hypothetical protein
LRRLTPPAAPETKTLEWRLQRLSVKANATALSELVEGLFIAGLFSLGFPESIPVFGQQFLIASSASTVLVLPFNLINSMMDYMQGLSTR